MARTLITFDDGPRQRSMIVDGNGGNGHTFRGQALTPGAIIAAFNRTWAVSDIRTDGEDRQVVCKPLKLSVLDQPLLVDPA